MTFIGFETTTTTPAAAPVLAKATPVYWRDSVRTPTLRKGFERILYAALADDMLTVAEVTARLLASGDYERVAPKAAALRPHRPVAFLLKAWAAEGLLRRSA